MADDDGAGLRAALLDKGAEESAARDAEGSRGRGAHVVRRTNSSKIRALLGKGRMYEHLYVMGDRNVIRVRSKRPDAPHVECDGDHEHDHDCTAPDTNVEHEHYIGGVRFAHKHAHGFEAHSHETLASDSSPFARATIYIILALGLCFIALGLGCEFWLKRTQEIGTLAHTVFKIAGPALIFSGLCFALVSALYFLILHRIDRAFHEAAEEEAKRGLLSQEGGAFTLPGDGNGDGGDGDADEDASVIQGDFLRLAISHLLSAWGDRMWQFAVPILMMHIFKDTLLPSALFALVQYLGCVVLMPRAGAWIDEAYRLPLMRAAIAVENVCVLLTCVTLASMVLRQGPGAGGKVDGAFAASFGALLVLGIAGEVMNQVQTIALEVSEIESKYEFVSIPSPNPPAPHPTNPTHQPRVCTQSPLACLTNRQRTYRIQTRTRQSYYTCTYILLLKFTLCV